MPVRRSDQTPPHGTPNTGGGKINRYDFHCRQTGL
jgi:hypothetical protein